MGIEYKYLKESMISPHWRSVRCHPHLNLYRQTQAQRTRYRIHASKRKKKTSSEDVDDFDSDRNSKGTFKQDIERSVEDRVENRRGQPLSWSEEVYGKAAFRPDEATQESAIETQVLSLDVGASSDSESDASATPNSEDASGALPSVSKGQVIIDKLGCSSHSRVKLTMIFCLKVFIACISTTAIFLFLAGFLRAYASAHGAPEDFVGDPTPLAIQDVGIVFATSTLVTLARVGLLKVSPQFAEATNRSNKQILDPMNYFDLVWLAFLPGLSEEALFRGALIPATFSDWRGAFISAAVFGYFHRSGGRNWIFAAWATLVGAIYGGTFLYTKNLGVPMMAHSFANLFAGIIALRKYNKQ